MTHQPFKYGDVVFSPLHVENARKNLREMATAFSLDEEDVCPEDDIAFAKYWDLLWMVLFVQDAVTDGVRQIIVPAQLLIAPMRVMDITGASNDWSVAGELAEFTTVEDWVRVPDMQLDSPDRGLCILARSQKASNKIESPL